MNLTRSDLQLAMKGFAMGVAEVIPGVSGGTIAFITGIYERLLSSIKSFDAGFIGYLVKLRLKDAWKHIDGGFLLTLISGMVLGVLLGIFGITHILETSPEVLWGLFFGLILASVWLIGREVDTGKAVHWFWFVFGAAFALFITWMNPVTGSPDLGYVFLCGMIAICALILPGVSGSFILLLLGMYTVVIPAVKDLLLERQLSDAILVLTFACGCLIGLLSFARVMSWMFRHYKMATLALLTGFMLGSLPKIWPWRNPLTWLDASGEIRQGVPFGEDYHIMKEALVLPAAYYKDSNTALVIVLCLVGIGIVIVLAKWGGKAISETGE